MKTKKNLKVSKSTLDLIDIVKYNLKFNCYETKCGKCFDLLQIKTRDIFNQTFDEREFDKNKLEKFFKIYQDDIKLIMLNYPCEISTQLDFFNKKFDKTTNQIYKKFFNYKIEELTWLSKNNYTKEFYLMIFADDFENLEKNRLLVYNTLGVNDMFGFIRRVETNKKHLILRKLCNKNSVI